MAILIVDDTAQNRLLLRSLLAAGGYESLEAEDARRAFDLLRIGNEECEEKCGEGIDLIIMDVMMPDVDGISATRRIKEHASLRDIPVIAITAHKDDEVLEAAFEAGVTDFLSWPVAKVELLARVRSALRLREELKNRKAREKELTTLTFRLSETNAKLTNANLLLQRLSAMDPLTGITNRRGFEETYQKSFRRAVRNGEPISVLMLDIDYFKAYNDTYGHQQGDECLRRIADVLRGSLRRPGDHVGRYGGEEFVAVLPETDMEGAVNTAERISRGIDELAIPHETSEIAGRVTVSIGIATATPDNREGHWKLLDNADQALYRAKQEGRNRYVTAPAQNSLRQIG